MKDERDLFDEAVLRRSLRLEPEERAPRLDAAALADAARRHDLALQRRLAATSLGAALVAVALAGPAGDLVRGILGAAVPEALAAGIDLALAVVIRVSPLVEAAVAALTQPATPLAILVATIVVAIYERRELIRAEAS